MPGLPVTAVKPLSLKGRGTGVAKRRQGEGAALLQSLTPALRATPLPYRERGRSAAAVGALALLLAGCAAAQSAAAVQPQAPGFWLGLWHGFIFPVAWAISLFVKDVSIYAVPNNGGWYDFGYFLGIVVFGVGARKSAVQIGGARGSAVEPAATPRPEEERR